MISEGSGTEVTFEAFTTLKWFISDASTSAGCPRRIVYRDQLTGTGTCCCMQQQRGSQTGHADALGVEWPCSLVPIVCTDKALTYEQAAQFVDRAGIYRTTLRCAHIGWCIGPMVLFLLQRVAGTVRQLHDQYLPATYTTRNVTSLIMADGTHAQPVVHTMLQAFLRHPTPPASVPTQHVDPITDCIAHSWLGWRFVWRRFLPTRG